MADFGNRILGADDNATMADDDQSERVGPPSENISSEQLPIGRSLTDVRESLTRKRALEEENQDDLSTATKLIKKPDEEGPEIVTAYQFSGRQVKEGEDNPTPLSSPASSLTFPFKRSDSEEDLNDEEVALLMAAPPKKQGNESEKNSPGGEQDSAPASSDDGSAGSEHNPSPYNDSSVKNDSTSE